MYILSETDIMQIFNKQTNDFLNAIDKEYLFSEVIQKQNHDSFDYLFENKDIKILTYTESI